MFFIFFFFALKALYASDILESLYTYQLIDHVINPDSKKLLIQKVDHDDDNALSWQNLLDAVQKDVRPFTVNTEKSAPLSDGGVALHFSLEGEHPSSVVIKITEWGALKSLEYECSSQGVEMSTPYATRLRKDDSICDISLKYDDGVIDADVRVLGKLLHLRAQKYMRTVAYTVSNPLRQLEHSIAFDQKLQNFFLCITMDSQDQVNEDASIAVSAMYDVKKNAVLLDCFYDMHCVRYCLSPPQVLKYIETRPVWKRLKPEVLEYGQFFVNTHERQGEADALILYSHIPSFWRSGVPYQISRIFLKYNGLFQLFSLLVRHDEEKENFCVQLSHVYTRMVRMIFAGRSMHDAPNRRWNLERRALGAGRLKLWSSCLRLRTPYDSGRIEPAALSIIIDEFGDGKESSAEFPFTPTNLAKILSVNKEDRSSRNIYPNAAACLVLQLRDNLCSLFTLKFVIFGQLFQILLRQKFCGAEYQDFHIFDCINQWGIKSKFHYVMQGDSVFTHFFTENDQELFPPAQVCAISDSATSIALNLMPHYFSECIIGVAERIPLTFNKKTFAINQVTKKYVCSFNYEELCDNMLCYRSMEFIFSPTPIAIAADKSGGTLASVIVNAYRTPESMTFSAYANEKSGRWYFTWLYNTVRYEQEFPKSLKTVQLNFDSDPIFAFYMKITDCDDDVHKVYISFDAKNSKLCFFNENNEEVRPDRAVSPYPFATKCAPAIKAAMPSQGAVYDTITKAYPVQQPLNLHSPHPWAYYAPLPLAVYAPPQPLAYHYQPASLALHPLNYPAQHVASFTPQTLPIWYQNGSVISDVFLPHSQPAYF